MFPEDPKDPRLLDEAEELLGDWPLPEKDDGDWEALAKSIDARIRITQVDATPDYLLEAPLPEESEVQRRSRPRMKRPAEGNLAALAKASIAKSESPDSARNAMALSLLSLAVKARSEARSGVENTAPTADAPREAGVGLSELVNAPQRPFLARRAASLESKRARTADSAATDEVGSRAAAPVEAVAVTSGRGTLETRRMWFGIAFGVLGMAAAGIMYVSSNRQGRDLEAQPVVAAAPGVAVVPTVQVPPAAEGAAEATQAINVEEVPLAPSKPTVVAAAPGPRAARAAARAVVAPSNQAAKAEMPSTPTAPPSVGPSEPGMVMADSRISLPDRPSTGALQAAVGAVMGAARACVTGQDAPSRATVHFGSDGRVQQVAVSGPATGTAAEPCLRSALGAARVQPFSRSSYSVSLTIRPN